MKIDKKLAVFLMIPILLFIILVIEILSSFSNNNTSTQESLDNITDSVPDVTIDSKTQLSTYKSQEGKFSISFPQNFSLHVNQVWVEEQKLYHPVSNTLEIDSPDKKTPYILIQYANTLPSESIDDYVENSSECDGLIDAKADTLIIGGVSAKIYQNISCNLNPITQIFIVHEGIGYNIIINEDHIDELILNNILKHFEFS